MKRNKQTNKRNEIIKKINKRNEEMKATNKENGQMITLFKKEVFYTEHGWVDVEKTIGKDVYKSFGYVNTDWVNVEHFKFINVELYKVIYNTEHNFIPDLVIQMLKGLVFDAKTKKFILLWEKASVVQERINWLKTQHIANEFMNSLPKYGDERIDITVINPW